MTVITVICILVVLLMPALASIQGRLEKANCIANLRNLHVAAGSYLADKKSWPQINTRLLNKDPEQYSKQWIAVLEPYGVAEKVWLCPSVERLVEQRRDKDKPKETRTDYMATPFDSKEYTPRKWARQPWFIERGDMHGNGNLMIFADGSTEEMMNLMYKDEKGKKK